MTGEKFYHEFKEGLDALGAGFTGMSAVTVTVEDNKVVMSLGNRVFTFSTGSAEE